MRNPLYYSWHLRCAWGTSCKNDFSQKKTIWATPPRFWRPGALPFGLFFDVIITQRSNLSLKLQYWGLGYCDGPSNWLANCYDERNDSNKEIKFFISFPFVAPVISEFLQEFLNSQPFARAQEIWRRGVSGRVCSAICIWQLRVAELNSRHVTVLTATHWWQWVCWKRHCRKWRAFGSPAGSPRNLVATQTAAVVPPVKRIFKLNCLGRN